LKGGYGFADREWNIPNMPIAKFRLASVSKQFTAACILQLTEKGKLHLDDKLNQFYPDFPKGDSVTIHMMLNHTSGIPSFVMQPDFGSYERLSLSEDSMINYFKNRPYNFTPGNKFQYNVSGYLLLACILERVTGQSFEQYLRKNILEKLDMKNTGNDRLDSILPFRVKGYDKDKNASFESMEWPLGGGSLYSTVEDLYKWDRALYSTSILSDASRQIMFSPGMSNYGCGIFIDSLFHHYRIHHGGATHGFSSNIARFPHEDICIIVLCNTENKALMIADGLAAILFNQEYELPEKYSSTSIDSMLVENFVGKYKLSEPVLYSSEIQLKRNGDRLFLNEPDIDLGDFPGLEFKPISDNIFVAEDFLMKLEFMISKNGNINQAFLIDGGAKIEMKKIE